MSATQYELKQLYFPHDIFADEDKKIAEMLYYFRTEKFSEDFLRRNFFLASYGLYWQIVQYLHRNKLKETDVSMLADKLRVDEEFIRLVLTNFELFHVDEDDLIVSDRVLRNLNKMLEKSNKSKEAANCKWIITDFENAYADVFGKKPVLSEEEGKALKRYSRVIPDFKTKLPDILYTLKNLKFDTDINFKPCANWLLAKNNLSRLVNGEFGKLKHRRSAEELKAEAEQRAAQEAAENAHDEIQNLIDNCSGKAEAMRIIRENVIRREGKVLFTPPLKGLMKKFDIRAGEITE